MQSTERFGVGTDPDGDGVMNELTRADITATVIFQATLPCRVALCPRPGRAESRPVGEKIAFGVRLCRLSHPEPAARQERLDLQRAQPL